MAAKASAMHFKTMVQADVPQGRNGKHKDVVTAILADLTNLKEGAALKVPLEKIGRASCRERV